MNAFGMALERHLTTLVDDIFATVEGVPASDFNTWKPAAATEDGHEMNTFAALLIHTVSAGEFMTLHAVGDEPSNRVREGEFEATGDLAEIRARYERWLHGVRAMLEGLTYEDLGRETSEPRYQERDWKVADVLLHALDHTALHVGHLQVQRQLWEVERSKP
jgi:hypothetical protein